MVYKAIRGGGGWGREWSCKIKLAKPVGGSKEEDKEERQKEGRLTFLRSCDTTFICCPLLRRYVRGTPVTLCEGQFRTRVTDQDT